jgi:hypothetical protein
MFPEKANLNPPEISKGLFIGTLCQLLGYLEGICFLYTGSISNLHTWSRFMAIPKIFIVVYDEVTFWSKYHCLHRATTIGILNEYFESGHFIALSLI